MPICKLNSTFLQHSKVSRFLHSSPFPFCHCPSRQLVPLYILLLLQCRYKEHPGEFILQTKLISRELGGVILPHFASSSYVCSSDTRSPSWLLPGTENLPCAGDSCHPGVDPHPVTTSSDLQELLAVSGYIFFKTEESCPFLEGLQSLHRLTYI